MRLVALAVVLSVAAACGGAGAGTPPAESPAPLPGAVLVTRASDHGTVHARVGDTIQIALGSDYEWRVDPPDGVVLARDPKKSYLLVRGTQAIWTAAAPGTSTITATGTVICPSGQACIMLALLFTTTVVVAP
jgi:hypothetical protein